MPRRPYGVKLMRRSMPKPLKHIIALIIRVLHVAIIFHLTTGNTFAVVQKIQ